jgi:hypothetical protein
MGTLRKVKGLHPLMDKGFGLLWYICMGEVQLLPCYWLPPPSRQLLSILSKKPVKKIKVLDEKVEGLTVRVAYQEFTNRGILIALVVAVLGGAAKLFGFFPNP